MEYHDKYIEEDKIIKKHYREMLEELKKVNPNLMFKLYVYGEDRSKELIQYWF